MIEPHHLVDVRDGLGGLVLMQDNRLVVEMGCIELGAGR